MTIPSQVAQERPSKKLTARSGLVALLVEVTRRGPVHGLLVLIGFFWLVPSAGLFATSFRTPESIASTGWWTALGDLSGLSVDNYYQAFVNSAGLPIASFAENFRNSFVITVPSTIFPILIAALAAYAFAWMRFPLRNALYLLIIALLIVPLQTTWVPVLRLFNVLELAGTWPGIWIAHTAYGTPFAIFLLRNFFADLPKEIFDSARVDGASELTTFFRIVIPLSLPAIASLAIFQFVWVWNDLLNALIFLQDADKLPLPVGVRNLLTEYATEWHLLSAGTFISMVVPLVIFFSLQRYFVRGVTAGAVKG